MVFGANFSLQSGQPVTYQQDNEYLGITVPSYGLKWESSANLSSFGYCSNIDTT
jgi:hypothetical protein